MRAGRRSPRPVTIAASAKLYGALDCAKGWVYDASKKTQLTAAADAIPLTLTSAASGTPSTTSPSRRPTRRRREGRPSRCSMTRRTSSWTASTWRPGPGRMARGRRAIQVTTPATAPGSDGGDDPMCNMTIGIRAAPEARTCATGTVTNGGNGGKGLAASVGDNGGNGQPTTTPSNGGSGQTTTQHACQPGQQGTLVASARAGTGARGIGDVSATGYQAAAAAGGNRHPGQGGGGGGGALACDAPTDMFAGPSGGGGGAGGCGGAPGNPGQSGGSSIGILALSATLTLTSVTIKTKTAAPVASVATGNVGAAGGSPATRADQRVVCLAGKGGQGGAAARRRRRGRALGRHRDQGRRCSPT